MMLHEKLEKKEFETGLAEEFLSEAKQFLYLDALAKIMMLTEGLLVLSDAISDSAKGYPKIAELMANYGDSPSAFIRRFRAKQVDLWKLAGLPALEELRINGHEKDALKGALEETVKIFEQFFTTIIEFYECNKIPYNKFKHGLSLIPGMALKNPQQETVAHVLTALDRRKQQPDCTCIQTTEKLVPPEVGWFNTLCFVASPQKEKYDLILNSLSSATSFMTSNHMFYAVNCGEDYFPLKMNPDNTYVPMLLLPRDSEYLQEAKKKELEPVIKKITDKHEHLQNDTFTFNLNFSEEKIRKVLKSFNEHGSAVMWSSEAASGSATVELTY